MRRIFLTQIDKSLPDQVETSNKSWFKGLGRREKGAVALAGPPLGLALSLL